MGTGATSSTVDPVIAAAARQHRAAGLLGIAWHVEQVVQSLGLMDYFADERGNGPFAAAVRSVTPRHRANVTERSAISMARCVEGHGPHQYRCDNWYCPRHMPASYADAMARHATDTI